jgi:hypothetical protein
MRSHHVVHHFAVNLFFFAVFPIRHPRANCVYYSSEERDTWETVCLSDREFVSSLSKYCRFLMFIADFSPLFFA